MESESLMVSVNNKELLKRTKNKTYVNKSILHWTQNSINTCSYNLFTSKGRQLSSVVSPFDQRPGQIHFWWKWFFNAQYNNACEDLSKGWDFSSNYAAVTVDIQFSRALWMVISICLLVGRLNVQQLLDCHGILYVAHWIKPTGLGDSLMFYWAPLYLAPLSV